MFFNILASKDPGIRQRGRLLGWKGEGVQGIQEGVVQADSETCHS